MAGGGLRVPGELGGKNTCDPRPWSDSAIAGIGGRRCARESVPMRWFVQIGLVALGSACGGVARWGLAAAAGRLCGTMFPFGTFLINITSSFFLGWFLTVLSERLGDGTWLRPDDLRLMVAVGFTGSFTTFSTFEYKSHGLLRDGDGLAAMTSIFLSVLLGLLAVRLGILAARLV